MISDYGQYCVRLPKEAVKQIRNFSLWRLSKPELKQVIDSINGGARWVRKTVSKRQPVPGKYHPTAIGRKTPPAPMREAVAAFDACSTVLYHGIGRDAPGAQLLRDRCKRVTVYDPYHPDPSITKLPQGQFDEVVSLYTLNVVDPQEGKRILKEIHRALKSGGHATIAVRRDIC